MNARPVLDGVAREHLARGALAGRRVALDVPLDEMTVHVVALLVASGAEVVADPEADLVVHGDSVVAGDAVVDVPVLDPTGAAHATIRALLRLTNRRLPGARVGVAGFDPSRRELARVLRALGGRVVVVDGDPLHRLAALADGHDLGALSDAEIVFADDVPELADGAVLAGPQPASVGAVVDEPRPGMFRVRRNDRDVFVLDPGALAGGRPSAALDLAWATRLVALAWLAESAPPAGRHALPVERQREIAAAALAARGVVA